jgi:hypothetical protein
MDLLMFSASRQLIVEKKEGENFQQPKWPCDQKSCGIVEMQKY